jgi:hypothetical protein
MLQTQPNIKNELLEIISNKEDKIQYIKEYYFTEDSFEVIIPKYIFIELLQEYENVLQNISNLINKVNFEETDINTFNSNNFPNSDTKDNIENNIIVDLARELNLQFDYSQYAEILNNKISEDSKKSEMYNFNDLDKESIIVEEPQHLTIKHGLRHKLKLKSTEFCSKDILM